MHFIPVEGAGGGAKEVVVYGGQVIDLILIDGGSGYTKAPRVVVSRGYNILRNNNYAESSFLVQRSADPAEVNGLEDGINHPDIPLWYWNLIEFT